MKLELILKSEITDSDILENISDECEAILLNDEIWWIEVCNGYFYVPDGWQGTKTTHINEAINALIKFKIDNQ